MLNAPSIDLLKNYSVKLQARVLICSRCFEFQPVGHLSRVDLVYVPEFLKPFLAPSGAQGVTMSVCSAQTCLEHRMLNLHLSFPLTGLPQASLTSISVLF